MKAFCIAAMVLMTASLAYAAAPAASKAGTAQRPNVVFILADDLGIGDLKCYGHPYSRTPNLDRLASEGTRFKEFHVTGVTCCPSRTGFMTGKHPASYATYPAGGGFGNRVTVTELLKKAGYATGHFGKWHIGPEQKAGTYGLDVTPNEHEERAAKRQRAERGRDAPIFDDAITFIEANRDRPFYVNVWGHITHNPVNPPKSYAEMFKNVAAKESDFPPAMREKFDIVRARGGDPAEAMRHYLGDMFSMDEDVGRLLAKIDELGLRENTIVVFSSDQGSPKPKLPEKERDKKKRSANDSTANRADYTVNLMGFNGGYRGGKHTMYEGGVRAPLIIRWPGRVPAGRVDESSVFSGMDWLPTLCAITGQKINAADFDGEDASAAWFGKPYTRSKPLVWKTSASGSDAGIRIGNWKLLHPTRKRGEDELYDLSVDAFEQNNVAAQHPDIVKRLAAQVEAWVVASVKMRTLDSRQC